MEVCSHDLMDFFLQNNPGVPAVVTSASCQPGYHSHPGATCHPMERAHNQQVRMQMGGDMAYYRIHPQEYQKAMQRSGGMVQNQVRCPSGQHQHPGAERCHDASGRHKSRAVAAMGGESGYYRLHPHAKKKTTGEKEPGKKRTRRTPEERAQIQAEAQAKREAREKLKKEGLEVQPIKRKLDKQEAKRESIEEIVRTLKGKSPSRRRKIVLDNLVPKIHHDSPETIVNPELLTTNSIAKLIQTSWLARYTTEFEGRKNQSTVYSRHHYDAKAKAKWTRMRSMAKQFGRIQRGAANDTKSGDITGINAQHGGAMLLLMRSGFRPGGKRYAEENGTFGITSLRRGDIKVMSGDKIKLSFIGKKKVQFNHTVSVGKPAHDYLKKLLKEPGKPTDKLFPDVDDNTMRQYLQRYDENLQPKDFRTLSVNREVFKMLSGIKGLKTEEERDLAAKRVISKVAHRHGHEYNAAITSYIHPMVLRAFIDGNRLPIWQGISKMLEKADESMNDYDYFDDLDELDQNFIAYLSSIHIV